MPNNVDGSAPNNSESDTSKGELQQAERIRTRVDPQRSEGKAQERHLRLLLEGLDSGDPRPADAAFLADVKREATHLAQKGKRAPVRR